VVALNGKSGKLQWHYQFKPHDMHDWVSTQPMVLVGETWEGQAFRSWQIHFPTIGWVAPGLRLVGPTGS
jgi:glucose dehydrogenase